MVVGFDFFNVIEGSVFYFDGVLILSFVILGRILSWGWRLI